MEPLQEIEPTGRKLASIQTISQLDNIENSESLSAAQVLGWQVVVKRDEFKVGQKIVYFEIDSILPEADWSSFLKERKYRIKTIKLRGALSQGLIMPMEILGKEIKEEDWEIGKDVTEIIGVKKYEEEEDFQADKGGKQSEFPKNIIEKTDEPRIQSEKKYLDIFKGKPYYAALKYDGTSATYFVDPNNLEEFYACSRNLRKLGADEFYNKVAEKYQIPEKLRKMKGRYAIQCEIYGPKILKNYLEAKEIKLVVYTIKDLIDSRFLDMEEMIQLCKEMDLKMVEIVEMGDSFNYTLAELKEKSKGKYPNTKNPREGLVFRLQKDWHKYRRCSFKIINDDYLLIKDKK